MVQPNAEPTGANLATERVVVLFEQLAELPEQAREALLTRECEGQPALREALERLLAHDAAASPEFLAPSRALLGEVVEAALGADVAQPTSVGRYTVARALGQGGMGVVYACFDPSLDRQVAVKLLRRGAAAGQWLLHEAQALARLSHPNVVAVHEVGEHEGQVYLAMELVEGPTLREWLKTPRPMAEVLRVFMDAARGLQAAHEKGLVHRDFKPDNVIVGHDGRARVVDFGVVTSSGAQASDTPIAGTPSFMSPEALAGGTCTPASDQWSFCVALAEAVTGALPFEARTLQGLLEETRAGRPLLPRQPATPAWLLPLLRRGLSPQPEARFPSVAALLSAMAARLPPHPELDGLRVGQQRQMVGLLLVVYTLGFAALVLTAEGRRWLAEPWVLVGIPLSMSVSAGLLTALRWRAATANTYGRRLSALLPFMGIVIGLSHGLAVRSGFSLDQLSAQNLLLLAMGLGLIGILHERWSLWLSGVAFSGVLCLLVWPTAASTLLGVVTLLCGVGMAIRLWLDRHQINEEKMHDALSGFHR